MEKKIIIKDVAIIMSYRQKFTGKVVAIVAVVLMALVMGKAICKHPTRENIPKRHFHFSSNLHLLFPFDPLEKYNRRKLLNLCKGAG